MAGVRRLFPALHAAMKTRYHLLPLCAVLALAGCASTGSLPQQTAQQHAVAAHFTETAGKLASPEERAVLYLNAAREASGRLASATAGAEARATYNQAAADLTVLLRSANNGKLWNEPLTLASGGSTFHLRFAKPTRDGVLDPAFFSGFIQASKVPNGNLKRRNLQDGIGGALVGEHRPAQREPFATPVGTNAAVTATLDFNGSAAVLSLLDPLDRTTARVAGKTLPLAADYSAPLAHYPQKSEFWHGLMGALRVEQNMGITGLYMVQPYDPDRIPLILVHGLISTPRMWRSVINELETDPEFRKRYQCWLFGYPTGNPPAYSALRLREELAKVRTLHPESPDFVLVGHSMGGLLSRMQATTVTREDWNAIGEDKAKKFFRSVQPGDLVDQATRFRANPHVVRVIFICTPHRGSEMAVGTLGSIGSKLIALPGNLTIAMTKSVGDSIGMLTGAPGRLPNSVDGLSPKNPLLKVLDQAPIQAPHHSIIGDRGKGDTPNSTDGVVAYWSSHLKSAKSELIVPGPHGSCELPETLAELRRILHLHHQRN